jgi:phenylpyruvate tautomerase PptA (4-oxalocrotonate tautomerase family)
MPHLRLQTNRELSPGGRSGLLARLSAAVAQALGKPQDYTMVTLQDGVPMAFAGSEAPAALVELRAIGLPRSDTPALSRALCDLLHRELQVSPERIYIEFADVPADLWGWNGDTF